MYYIHNLRVKVQEWKDRIYRSSHHQFGNHVKYFFQNLRNERIINSILESLLKKYPNDDETLERWMNSFRVLGGRKFENEEQHGISCFALIEFLYRTHPEVQLIHFHAFISGDPVRTIIDDLIEPIAALIHDKLEEAGSIIYLMEKYKKRTEWFTRNDLRKKYLALEKNYEQLLEDDLRLFLFDQGIEYPFSTPQSSTGRADIVGQLDTNDPLIVEIKIWDSSKTYGAKRVKSGFSQVVDYTNDYNKDTGFLVIFNLDECVFEFEGTEDISAWPAQIRKGGKTYYIIVVDLYEPTPASKKGKLKIVSVNLE